MSPRPPRSLLRRARLQARWRRRPAGASAAARPSRGELRRQRSRVRIQHRARSVVALLVVASLAVFAFGFSTSVEVQVDGETHTLRTFSGNVEQVLEQLEIAVGPADEVSPPLDAPITDGTSIEIDRAITVDVAIDGSVARRVTAPVSSVAGVLELAELEHLDELGARVHPNRRAEVQDGDVVEVSLPLEVTIEVDGEQIQLDTFERDIEHVLLQAGVELDDDDEVLPGEQGALLGPTVLTVRRVSHDEEVEEVSVPFEEVRRESGDLDRGSTRVEQEGRNGLRHDVYRLTFVDGEQTDRELVSQEMVEEPRDRIVIVGTRTPPPPPSSSASSGDDSVWDRLARCESGGNWSINTGNGYYGGLQFSASTWRSVGGSGLPHEHSRAEQIKRGKILQQRAGWGQWPACSRKLGLR